MERALNPDVLSDALGIHVPGVLPTVDELIELIATVEIRAFTRSFEVADDLLRSAWYLHGVASASAAFELYSLPRQRRAFAVSAHIFDLALNDASRDSHDRLTLAFAAQVGYRRAELDPNAAAVYRRVVDLLPGSDGGELDTLALRTGVALLGLEVQRLTPWLRAWRRQLTALAGVLEVDNLTTTMFGPAQQVVLAASSLLGFLRRGDVTQLEVAQTALASVLDLTAGQGDHDARWVAAHLLQIAGGMQGGSVWTVLPSGAPAAVAQAFTVGSPPVLTLWPPQRELLTRPRQNPLDPDTKRLLLSVPTSAGKTLVAQILICSHLATQPGDVCYITPLRSLGREMRQALRSRLRVLNRELGTELPDFATASIDELLAILVEVERGDVEVMTPERLMQLLRRDPQSVLSRFTLFVIDEAHMLAQPGRGLLLESLLGFLSAADARLVLLSGVLGNAGTVATWLAPDEPDVLYTSDWRGPRRMHGLLYASAQWDQKDERPRKSKTHPITVSVPLIAKLRVRPAEAQTVDLYVTDEAGPLGTLVLKKDPLGALTRAPGEGTPFYRVAAKAASALLHAGSLLMIVSTRDLARSAAGVLAEELPDATSTRELEAFLTERLGAQHPLVSTVRKGVGYHHAGLPVDVLDAIEDAIRNDQLVAVVATSTLTDGVNLPVRTVVIAETAYEGQRAGGRLDAPRLLNAVGRAGRAGRETEGWIVMALQKAESLDDFELLQPTAEALQATSTLLTPDALASLAYAESLLAETADAILRLPPGPASDFASYVWFVLSALEQVGALPRATNVVEAVTNLLGFHQMGDALRGRWLSFVDSIGVTYDRADVDRRRRWGATGMSIASAARIDRLVDRVLQETVDVYPGLAAPGAEPAELSLDATLSLLERSDAYFEMLELPEADRAWRFRTTRHGGAAVEVSVSESLRAWTGGAEMPDLARQMLPELADETWMLEQTVDAVSTAFEHYLSWTIGIVVDHVNARLSTSDAAVRLRHDLAWLVRYGVDTAQALALLTQGVQSRRLAYRLGRLCTDRGWEIAELREWLADLHIGGWRTEFAATPREVLDLLEFTRARRQSILRTLLESGTASVDVRVIGGERPDPQEVTLRASDNPPAELQVIDGATVVGVVGASNHADVDAVLTSGLDVRAVLVGALLTLDVVEDGA